ncbi:response regulator [Ramlibacter henchirensis]|uniref:Response regulator n=1 Tax=Ramlibacter henchirensis TaxID=204072 RepID=A0A4Z0C6V8_9BURK|nr:response regulator [Ramlibacter henchirensis]TFZ07353.1 response regulator [Ramlibacter henchirensis]
MTFPLFKRPGTLVFLDDDADYLEMLALMLPRKWRARLFVQPRECIRQLQQERPFWEADAWYQQQLVDQWRAGRPLVPQVLEYWARQTERFSLTSVCAVDYSMPEMDGLQALAELGDWPGARVLLTGQADDQVAIDAFNAGLIQQFIPKQTADIAARLLEVVDRLQGTPHPTHAQTWRATLRPEQAALLRNPAIERELATLADKHWVEHIVIGDPFGVIGLDAAGSPSWLQLETGAGLPALAELAQLEGVDAPVVQDVRDGLKLVDLEVSQSLRRPPQVAQAVALDADRSLFAAWFPLEAQGLADAGYSRWLARQPQRRIDA